MKDSSNSGDCGKELPEVEANDAQDDGRVEKLESGSMRESPETSAELAEKNSLEPDIGKGRTNSEGRGGRFMGCLREVARGGRLAMSFSIGGGADICGRCGSCILGKSGRGACRRGTSSEAELRALPFDFVRVLDHIFPANEVALLTLLALFFEDRDGVEAFAFNCPNSLAVEYLLCPNSVSLSTGVITVGESSADISDDPD
jgi:hypothetical protein